MTRTQHLLLLFITLNLGLLSNVYPENVLTNPTEIKNLKNLKNNGEYVRTRFLQKMKKPFINTQKKKVLIIGDSHAQDFFNGILENNFLDHYQISTRYIPTRCQIYLSDNMLRFTKKEDKELCKKSDNLLHARQQINEADVIILVASWREWSAKELPLTIHNMKLNSKQKLFVIGRKSFSKPFISDYGKYSKNELLNLNNNVDRHQLKINKIMKERLNINIFINLHQLICGNKSSSCPAFSDDHKLISFDGGHFTKAGARYITKILFKKSALGRL